MVAGTLQQQLWRNKQSEAVKHLLRLHAFELRQLPNIHRVSKPTAPHKARQMGYKAKQGKFYKFLFNALNKAMKLRIPPYPRFR